MMWGHQMSGYQSVEIKLISKLKYTIHNITHYCDLFTDMVSSYSYNTYKLTMLMQGNDIEMNPGPTPGNLSITTVQGSFHQGDPKQFQGKSVGKQCVTNSIMAIIYSNMLPMKYWEQKHLDEILRIGDRLYQRINCSHAYLLVSDIPNIITEFGEQYSITRNSELFGPIKNTLPAGIGQELDQSIRSMIKENMSTTGVLCIGQTPDASLHSRLQGGSACSLVVAKNNFYIFDSHSRDRNGKVAESGTSILLHFTTIKQHCSHIRDVCHSLNCNYYEITIINVSNLYLERYLNDQKRLQAQKDLVTKDQRSSNTENQCYLSKRERQELRHEKNHLQMIKKHQESTYREKERIKDKGSK